MMGSQSTVGHGSGARALTVRAARTAVASALCAAGAPWLVRTLARRQAPAGRVLIVMYHLPTRAAPAADGPVLPSLCVTAATLRRHLEHLARVREVVSMEEAWRRLSAPAPARRRGRASDMAVVTFDDGYAGVHELALPILRELRLPALAYVPTGFIGSGQVLPHDRLHAALVELRRRGLEKAAAGLPRPQQALLDGCSGEEPGAVLDQLIATVPHDRLVALAGALEGRLGLGERDLPAETRLMSWEQLRELKASGVDVGGHTVHHVELANVPLATARAEIEGCRDQLAAQLGAPPRHFSYPNCYYTARVKRAVAAAGYVTAVSGPDTAEQRAPDLLALKRRALCEDSTEGALGYSRALAACYFDEVFAALRLQRGIAFERPEVAGAERAG